MDTVHKAVAGQVPEACYENALAAVIAGVKAAVSTQTAVGINIVNTIMLSSITFLKTLPSDMEYLLKVALFSGHVGCQWPTGTTGRDMSARPIVFDFMGLANRCVEIETNNADATVDSIVGAIGDLVKIIRREDDSYFMEGEEGQGRGEQPKTKDVFDSIDQEDWEVFPFNCLYFETADAPEGSGDGASKKKQNNKKDRPTNELIAQASYEIIRATAGLDTDSNVARGVWTATGPKKEVLYRGLE